MDHADGCDERKRQRQRAVLRGRKRIDDATVWNTDDRGTNVHRESGRRVVLAVVLSDVAIDCCIGEHWIDERHSGDRLQLGGDEQRHVMVERDRRRERKRQRHGQFQRDRQHVVDATIGNADDRGADIHRESGRRRVLAIVLSDVAIDCRIGEYWIDERHSGDRLQLGGDEQRHVMVERDRRREREWQRHGQFQRDCQHVVDATIGNADDRGTDIHRESGRRRVFAVILSDLAISWGICQQWHDQRYGGGWLQLVGHKQ
jgi:hypothetical protein